MVDFWFNHFNVNAYNGFDMLWVGNFENEAIRPHVLGHFRDLVLATAQHPAMLYYLDNQDSTAPGSPSASTLFSDINENYARELMELHTLGVDGGYTQQDVIDAGAYPGRMGFQLSEPKRRFRPGFRVHRVAPRPVRENLSRPAHRAGRRSSRA